MIIDDKTKDEKLQHTIYMEAAKILALPPGEIDKYEYLTGKKILPSDQSRIIEQAKGIKQVEALKVVYNRVFWHTLGRAQNNNYKNQIKKIIPLKLTKILIILIFKVLSNN